MNYRFLALKGIEKFFEESNMTVGEIMRSITQEKFTGLEVKNKSVFTETSDEQWCTIIEKTFENERE